MMDQEPGLTGKEMCDFAVQVYNAAFQPTTPLTAEALWNYSPRGELSKVFEVYGWAKANAATYGIPIPEPHV